MPGLQQTVTQTTDLQLRPEQRLRLEAALDTYTLLKTDIALLTEQMEIEKSKIGKVLADYGVDKAQTEDFHLCWIRGSHSSSLDKKKLIAQGVTTAMLEAAMVSKPKKDYFMIRAANESGE
jgi:hypothetical protein